MHDPWANISDRDLLRLQTEAYPSFLDMFRKVRYLKLLHGLPDATVEIVRRCLAASPDPEEEIVQMLDRDWRPQLVAAVAALEHGPSDRILAALWQALDDESWVTPQLCLVLAVIDPQAEQEMKKRLIQGCLAPKKRWQLVKSWATMCWYLALSQEGRAWLLARFSAEEVLSRVLDLSGRGKEGPDNANDWYKDLRRFRPDFDAGPPFAEGHPACGVAKLWLTEEHLSQLRCPAATVRALVADRWSREAMLEPLLRPGLDKGDDHFEFRSDGVYSLRACVPIEPGLRDIIVDFLPGNPHWSDVVGRMPASERLPEFVVSGQGGVIHLQRPAARRTLEGRLNLSRDLLQNAATDVICYGAKDTGEMGGGAAMAVYQACGPELLESVREKLASVSREVGQVVLTPAFRHAGADIVGHIISIKTGTAQGDWCPHPEQLGEGVTRVLAELKALRVKEIQSVAFSCLATGEGRADPKRIAQLMIGGARRFFRETPDSRMKVLFCLPNARDYEAFEHALSSRD